MENRHGLIVDCKVTQATGTGERDAAKAMAADIPCAHKKTLAADKNHDTKGFVTEMRRIAITPHVAQNTSRRRSTPAEASRRCLVGSRRSLLHRSKSGVDCASSSCAAQAR